MKYLVVQDWQSTHGNHAGMVHMCKLLIDKYPNEYEIIIKECPKVWKSPKTITEKIRWYFYDKRKQKKYISEIYPKEYLQICKSMFSQLKNNDEVYLLEYLLPMVSQFELAIYIRKHFPMVKIYALVHLTCKYFDTLRLHQSDIITKWVQPIDRLLTLGSSLSTYFEKAGVPKEKISTGFHYVDSEYYHKNTKLRINKPLTIITMGALQRDYSLLSEVVKKCANIQWIICRGNKDVNHLFHKANNVKLMGYLPENELRNLMDISDISLNIMEDTVGSNVITTSMAMGLAMIVSDVGSIRDYLDSTNTIFCENNVESFVSAIKELVSNPKRLVAMRKHSLDEVNNLTIDKVHDWFDCLNHTRV